MRQVVVLLILIVGLLALGEWGIRVVETRGLPLWWVTTLVLAVMVWVLGLAFFLSHFLAERWTLFRPFRWVCENILPFGRRHGALVLGLSGMLAGLWALWRLWTTLPTP